MTWHNDPARNRAFAGGETAKIRWEVLPWTQGIGLDIGCGPHKLSPEAIGIDQHPHRGLNLRGDVANLRLLADGQMDYVYSSHCLEDIEDHAAALGEWWRVLKTGGYLVLYLPHAALYPRIGQPGANHQHKHDFLPEDIVQTMREVAPDWLLREHQTRGEDDEYSFLQVYEKRAPGQGQAFEIEKRDPAKRCIVMRYGGFGDMFVSGSTFPHLKAEGLHLTVYTGIKGEEVLRHDPHIDRIIVHDIMALRAGELRELCDYLRPRCARFINFSETFESLLLASPSRPAFWWSHEMRHRYLNGNYLEAAHTAAGVPQQYQQRFYDTEAERAEAAAWRRDKPRLVVVAATGTGVNKIWPHLFEYVGRLALSHPDVHVAVMGELQGAHVFEHERIHEISQQWSIRKALALARQGDLVIGPETGILNGVAHEAMPKIVLLSHSTEENLTKHWTNTHALHADVPCYPCHRLHADWSGCKQDPQTQFAACASAIGPFEALRLTERLLGLQAQLAA